MKILGNRVLVSPLEKEVKEGFQTVDVQDSLVYKGRIEQIGDTFLTTATSYQGLYEVGSIILFAKYSPDTHEIEHEGKKYKVVEVSDILAVL